jgi:hypothetical protein
MSEVAHGTQQEFWSPPAHHLGDLVSDHERVSSMAEACPRCGTEFLLGSHFCHSCGGRRPEAMSLEARSDAAEMAGLWERAVHGVASIGSLVSQAASHIRVEFPAWLRYLHFHEIKKRIGLSAGSLVAFMIGIGCVAGALLVGLLTAKTLGDWQAIQVYRAEWLLAATTAFLAGILLKKPGNKQD